MGRLRPPGPSGPRRLRAALLALLLVAGYYAVFGGEYSWFELRATRRAEAAEEARLAGLRRSIDSLRAWADSLQVDSATLERIAREKFGMIREGEILYLWADRDSSPPEEAARPPGR